MEEKRCSYYQRLRFRVLLKNHRSILLMFPVQNNRSFRSAHHQFQGQILISILQTVANYKLGGSFNGIFNLILREEKGFTYGARSGFHGAKNYGTFIASSRVRTNSTLESVTIFKTEMEKYRKEMPQDYIDFTKSSLLKSNALRFETLGSLLGMLNTMTSYDLPADYHQAGRGICERI